MNHVKRGANLINALIVSASRDNGSLIGQITEEIANTLTAKGACLTTNYLDRMGADVSNNVCMPYQTDRSNDVCACDLLVLVFPLTWCTTPASVNEWLTKIFSSETRCSGNPMNSRGCMAGRRVIVIATQAGPITYNNHAPKEVAIADMLQSLLKGTLNFLGFTVLDPYFIVDADRISDFGTSKNRGDLHNIFLTIQDRNKYFGIWENFENALRFAMS